MSNQNLALPMVSIRAAVETDRNFIFKSWLNSNYDGSSARYLARSVYFPHHWKAATRLFSKALSLIVHDKEFPDHILGFAIFRQVDDVLVMDYVYIKAAFRKMGIGSLLFNTAKSLAHRDESKPWVYTHRTNHVKRSVDEMGGIYNPYLLFEVLDESEKSESHASSVSRELHGGDVLS